MAAPVSKLKSEALLLPRLRFDVVPNALLNDRHRLPVELSEFFAAKARLDDPKEPHHNSVGGIVLKSDGLTVTVRV